MWMKIFEKIFVYMVDCEQKQNDMMFLDLSGEERFLVDRENVIFA